MIFQFSSDSLTSATRSATVAFALRFASSLVKSYVSTNFIQWNSSIICFKLRNVYLFFSKDLTESQLPPSHASCNRVKPFLIIRFKMFQQDTQQEPNVPQHAECRGVQLYLSTTTLKSFFFSMRFFIVYISCFSQA